MDLEIAVYVMPRLPCARGSYVATLREVTNGIIENQYLRLVLTLVYSTLPDPSSPPDHPLPRRFVPPQRFTMLVLNLSDCMRTITVVSAKRFTGSH